MDLLIFLLAFVLGFGLFISTAYFLAKLMFPRLEDEENGVTAFTRAHKKYMPRINRSANPYSFIKNHRYSH